MPSDEDAHNGEERGPVKRITPAMIDDIARRYDMFFLAGERAKRAPRPAGPAVVWPLATRKGPGAESGNRMPLPRPAFPLARASQPWTASQPNAARFEAVLLPPPLPAALPPLPWRPPLRPPPPPSLKKPLLDAARTRVQVSNPAGVAGQSSPNTSDWSTDSASRPQTPSAQLTSGAIDVLAQFSTEGGEVGEEVEVEVVGDVGELELGGVEEVEVEAVKGTALPVNLLAEQRDAQRRGSSTERQGSSTEPHGIAPPEALDAPAMMNAVSRITGRFFPGFVPDVPQRCMPRETAPRPGSLYRLSCLCDTDRHRDDSGAGRGGWAARAQGGGG